jgi:hypothetical protein
MRIVALGETLNNTSEVFLTDYLVWFDMCRMIVFWFFDIPHGVLFEKRCWIDRVPERTA